jgi:tetratricopeptide (TPR) repeat protein
MRERRWRVDAQIVDECRQAADAASAPVPAHFLFRSGPERLRYLFMHRLGMALTWHGDLAEARVAYKQALASAKREGSPVATAAALGGLATTAFRGGDIETVRLLLPEARAAAASSRPCLANAIALGAWLAWRDGQPEEAIALAGEAVELWEPRPDFFYPYCLAFWPLAGSHLDLGRIEEAVGAARRLLDPSLARLPDDLEASAQAACDAWDRGRPEPAGRLLAEAVQLACNLGYA